MNLSNLFVSKDLKRAVESRNETIDFLQERLHELEVAKDNWMLIGSEGERDFSKAFLDKINRMARLYWLKNPLIRRAVLTQSQYVFGQGVSFSSREEKINDIIKDVTSDGENDRELFSQQALIQKETELQLFGNIFFVIFRMPKTGRVKIRTIPMDEISDIVTDKDDRKKPLYYVRTYTVNGRVQKLYYPDINNNMSQKERSNGSYENAVIFHISVNSLSDMKYGVSEVYSAIDWSKAYKEFLENWATLVDSYATFAWKVTTKDKKGVSKVKHKFGTQDGSKTDKGAVWAQREGTNLEPIKTSGPAVRADDGNKMIQMISAATGVFYHYLTGDPSTGNLATAKAMERPMELMFRDRQQYWRDVFKRIFKYAIESAALAPKGKITGEYRTDEDNERYIRLERGEDGEYLSPIVEVVFPDLLEHDVKSRVDAIVRAATLGTGQLANIIDERLVSKLLLTALDVENVEDVVAKMYDEAGSAINTKFKNSIRELTEAIKGINDSRESK